MFQNVCVLAFCFIAVNAGLIPLESAKYLEGPSSNTKLFGPDGSVINAYAPGGKVLLDAHAAPLLQPAPVVYAHPSIAGFEYQQLVVPESVSNAVEARESAPVKEETEETTAYTTELPATTEEVQTSTPDVSGAYVPDNFEKLFDDGSYKPAYY
ncbi:uncharacterized protein LOC143200970 [Rhynchophorus ferrugineus]|uniref:uncharacterized protein LOC143200970 n=1 Tax=Rhynchophorus ferrugineus TaxID=354439 RepID=UPI003FCDB939